MAAGFEAMRRDGDALMGGVAASFEGGGRRFFNQGTNGRWRGVFREEDLALYEARVAATLPAGCARWVAAGRLKAGEAPFGSGLRRLAAVAAVREKPAAWNARGGCTWAA